MFELTTSNLDHELREQKIAEDLRRRELMATATSDATRPTTTSATPRVRAQAGAPATRRATAQR